jgi:hypothetical protein
MYEFMHEEQEFNYTPVGTAESGSMFGGEVVEEKYVKMRFKKYCIDEIRCRLKSLEVVIQNSIGERLFHELGLDTLRNGDYLDEGFEPASNAVRRWMKQQPLDDELRKHFNDYFVGSMIEFLYPYGEELRVRNAPEIWVKKI